MNENNEGIEFVNFNDPDFIAAMDKHMVTVGRLRVEFEEADTYYKKLQAIKNYYLAYESEMIAKPRLWNSAYPIDWSLMFTPIESEAWNTIRGMGHVILYPQYPVLNYYVDFGNPGLKIALEIDGKQFHNKERDTIRDTELKKAGWTVYRITGSEMVNHDYKDISECINEELEEGEALGYIKDWLRNTGDGVIRAIREIHFEDWSKEGELPYLHLQYLNYCRLTLDEHRLV